MLYCYLLLSNLLGFLQLKKTHDFFSSNWVSWTCTWIRIQKKLLDPDPHKMNVDPQPCFQPC